MSAEEDPLRCRLGGLRAMYQIQNPVPFHTDQHEAGAEAIGQVSSASSGKKNGKL